MFYTSFNDLTNVVSFRIAACIHGPLSSVWTLWLVLTGNNSGSRVLADY